MKQGTLAAAGFERYVKKTRRATFLAELEQVVPRVALCALIEPVYPKSGNGRSPVGLERITLNYSPWLTTIQPRRRKTIWVGDSRVSRPIGAELRRRFRSRSATGLANLNRLETRTQIKPVWSNEAGVVALRPVVKWLW